VTDHLSPFREIAPSANPSRSAGTDTWRCPRPSLRPAADSGSNVPKHPAVTAVPVDDVESLPGRGTVIEHDARSVRRCSIRTNRERTDAFALWRVARLLPPENDRPRTWIWLLRQFRNYES
jgi:hypothetical protein